MPFGAVFGAVVFGLLGLRLGILRLVMPFVGVKVIGISLIVLGISLSLGLLRRRDWARWAGVVSGLCFAYFAIPLAANGRVIGYFVVLAALLTSVLLIVPATGRFARAAIASPVADGTPGLITTAPDRGGRALPAVALLAFAAMVGGKGWDYTHPLIRPPLRAAAAAPAPGATTAEGSSEVPWSDFATGIKEAKSDRKLIVADFYAIWCGPCKMMERQTFRDPRVVTRLKDVVPVRVDSEEEVDRGGVKGIDLATRYAIDVYPTIVVIDGQGNEVARSSGFMGADEFLSWLDAVIERAGTRVAHA